jgi:hypothetical protein
MPRAATPGKANWGMLIQNSKSFLLEESETYV